MQGTQNLIPRKGPGFTSRRQSHRELLRENANWRRAVAVLEVELFCANPDHPLFRDVPEERLAELRRERIRRTS